MPQLPSDSELIEAIQVVLLMDAEIDTETLVSRIKDDKFLWKVTPVHVERCLKLIQANKKYVYQPPANRCSYDFSRGMSYDVTTMDLTTCEFEGILHSQGGLGSSGVYLLKLFPHSCNGVVVLKRASLSLVGEHFAGLLYPYFGIACPATRLLNSEEFQNLVLKLRNVPLCVPDTCRELFEVEEREIGVLMEFVNGIDLENKIVGGLLSKNADQLFYQIGTIIAVDMLLNNFDRIPYIWRHAGNAGNLLINGDTMMVYSIDHTFTPISNGERKTLYLEKVRSGIQEAKLGSGKGEHVQKVKQFIKQNCNFVMTEQHCKEMQRGIMHGTNSIVTNKSMIHGAIESTAQTFNEILQSKQKFVGIEVFQHEATHVDVEFLKDVLKSMLSALQ